MDNKPFSEPAIAYKKSSKRPGGILVLVLILIAVLTLIFLALRYVNENELLQVGLPKAAPTPTVTPREVSPTSQPPTPTPTEAAEELDRSELTVSVQNGSGTRGAASELSTYLEDLGYDIGTIGNADSFDYEGVTIRVKKSQEDYLPQLRKDIEEEYTVTDATADLPSGNAADAIVIYGKE